MVWIGADIDLKRLVFRDKDLKRLVSARTYFKGFEVVGQFLSFSHL